MNLVISLEDQKPVAEDILDRITTRDTDKRIVLFYGRTGAILTPAKVALEASNLVYEAEGRTVFLVDLVEQERKTTNEYGLQVISSLRDNLGPGTPLSEFLRDENFLVVAVTNFPPTPVDLENEWGSEAASIKIQTIGSFEDIKKTLERRREESILPVVDKPGMRTWIPRLVADYLG